MLGKLKLKLNTFFLEGHSRTLLAKKNIVESFLIRFISIIVSFIMVPLTIKYVSTSSYGIWLSLSSIIAWINFFDVGLGNGLKNKLTEAIANNDFRTAKILVSTTYFIISIIAFILLLIFYVWNSQTDWNNILNLNTHEKDLNFTALIVVSCFSFQFILQIINSIHSSYQKISRPAFWNLIASLSSFVTIFICTFFFKGTLLVLSIALCVPQIIVLVINNLFSFKCYYGKIYPAINSVNLKYSKDLFGLGFKFFVIQISALILNQTTNFLMIRSFGPQYVSSYNISFKYYGICTMIFTIIMTPYWTAFADAFAKKDYLWISRAEKQLINVWFYILGFSVILLVFSGFVYSVWLGDLIHINKNLDLWVFIAILVSTFSSIYVTILNGLGIVKIQFIASIISAILFFPLAKALIQFCGPSGLIITSILCNVNGLLLAPLEFKKFKKNLKIKINENII